MRTSEATNTLVIPHKMQGKVKTFSFFFNSPLFYSHSRLIQVSQEYPKELMVIARADFLV